MRFVGDNGPVYAETLSGKFPVEPWNTWSNLIFLFIVIYWYSKIRFNFRTFPFLSTCLPVLLLGFVGGTVYHATRSHNIWLVLDFMPIFVLVCAAGVFFWYKLFRNIMLAALFALLPAFLIRSILWSIELPRELLIGLSYSSLASIVLLPAFLFCWKNRGENVRLLLGAVLLFGVAVFFRQIDGGAGEKLLPMGTHFLWHIFGGGSVLLLTHYVYRVEKNQSPSTIPF